MKKNNIPDMLIFIVSAELTGALSALLTGSFSALFEKYKEPPLLPPAWLFPVVWTILYAVMGYSAYLVSISDKRDARKKALAIYWTQLGVNFLWSIVFFRFEALWAAFGVILLLLALIIAMLTAFRKVNLTAAVLNIPYLLWVIFASYLNYMTAHIN